MVSSDAKKVTICKQCKKKINTGNKICTICKSEASDVIMPSAADLLIQELQSMCINVDLII